MTYKPIYNNPTLLLPNTAFIYRTSQLVSPITHVLLVNLMIQFQVNKTHLV